MTQIDEAPPVGQSPNDDSSGAVTPPGQNGDSSAADREKALQDKLSSQGRKLQAMEETNAALAAQMANANAYLQKFGAVVSRQQQQEAVANLKAQIDALPEDQRVSKLLELVIMSPAPAPPPMQVPQPETPTQRKYRLTKEILEEVNREFGFTGDQVITGDEEDIDSDSEAAFRKTTRLLAKVKQKETPTVPRKAATEPPKSSNTEELKDEIYNKVMEDLGIGKANSARPTGGGGKADANDVSGNFRKIAAQSGSKLGSAGKLKLMRKLRDG